MQKIASIEKILEIIAHPNADKVEIAKILGFNCVVKKGEFKKDDLVIFIEPDSIISENYRHISHFQFLEKRGWKIREEKFRGIISSGLIVNSSIFEELGLNITLSEGLIVAEQIGVQHYEKPNTIINNSDASGHFPSKLFPKTDEPNLKSNIYSLVNFYGKESFITLKMDGSSLSAYYFEGKIGVCSRNLELRENENNKFWNIVKKLHVDDFLVDLYRVTGHYYSVQGEYCGPGINGNRIGLHAPELYIFNLYNISKKEYCDFEKFVSFCNAYKLPTVPIIWEGIFNANLKWLTDFASQQKYANGNLAEGIVLRPKKESYNDSIGRLSVKIVNPEYE